MIKKIMYVGIGLISLYFGNWAYQYTFNKSVPTITLSGVEHDGCYAGDLQCSLEGEHSFKVANINVYLDDSTLVNDFSVHKKVFEHSFTIPTRTLPNGKHVLKVEATSGTYAGNIAEKEIEFTVDNVPLQGALIKTDADNKVFQGRTLHVQFQVNKELKDAKVSVLGEDYEAFPESKNALVYETYVPISCEEKPNEYLVAVDALDTVGNTIRLENKFQVVQFPFKKSTLHVSAEKIKEEKEIGASNDELEERLKMLVAQSPRKKLWSGVFYPPIEITAVSTEYGTVRTTQERGRYMHKAVDVLNTPKSVVWAPARGTVILKDRFAYSGNTIVLDHGYSVFSMFFHLDEFSDIAIGDTIERGRPLGTLGKTGYASGYHLHWEMRIANNHVDPLQWIKPGF